MKQAEVSIIVPIYNAEEYLPRCIESIQKQSLQDIEIVFVDDGSTDASRAVCEKYAGMDERIKILHQENMGQVAARNAGIALAGGKYIGFVDSDDWIEQDMFSILYSEAVKSGADIVMEGMLEDVDGACCPCKNVLPSGIYRTEDEKDYLHRNMLCCENYFRLGVQPYLWNKLFKTELVKAHMPYIDKRIRIGEDMAAVYTMLLYAECSVILSTCHYHYCLRNDSVMMQGLEREKELESIRELYFYLLGLGEERCCRQEKEILHYTVHNFLTRRYEESALIRNNSLLFPFENIKKGDSLIIYGAGAFGRAVYRYASAMPELGLKGWADGNAEKYQKMGLPVSYINEMKITARDKIVVAVFSETQFLQIKQFLLSCDIAEKQIHFLTISHEEENILCQFIME